MKHKGKQVADYAWLHKGYQYWNIYLGNPTDTILIRRKRSEISEKDLIADIKRIQGIEKRRYLREFLNAIWRSFTN